MMMWASNRSAATASDDTDTGGLGGGISRGSQSDSSSSYLRLIICCFLPSGCPHAEFYPNRTENVEVKRIDCRVASVGWSGQSKNRGIHFIPSSNSATRNAPLPHRPNLSAM